jgi:hypothetical protein
MWRQWWNVDLIAGWSNGALVLYIALALVLSAFARIALAWVRAIKPGQYGTTRSLWWKYICSSAALDLDPTILGTLELLVYPLLMKAHAWTFIGAWLGFKTLGQWNAWQQRRAEYNLFLIGNALVLILSFLVLTPLVPSGCALLTRLAPTQQEHQQGQP